MLNPRNPTNTETWVRKTEVAYFKDRILMKHEGKICRRGWDEVSKFILDLKERGSYQELIKRTLYIYEVVEARSPSEFVRAS